MPPSSSPAEAGQSTRDRRYRQVRAEQVRLLYRNATTGVWVTVVVASVLAYLQWRVISHHVILVWLLYMAAVSAARFTLGRYYWRTRPSFPNLRVWGDAFIAGTGLAAMGWGAAGVLLNPGAHVTNQVFLAFVIGGMMLGSGSILAARPEAFFGFIVPAGLPITIRFLLQGDDAHLGMGILGLVFTAASLITTWHIYLTVRASLNLQFENQDLVADLSQAKQHAETLNQQLEARVQERTAELHQSNARLQAEFAQRRQAEEELLRSRKLEAVGVLAGGIAHDFNNFLTIVQGNLGLARMELESGGSIGDILDQTAAACQRAAALAFQLLTLGKGGAPVRVPASVARVVSGAVDLAGAGANVSIRAAMAGDLWPAEIDASQISQTLHNILLNARQAMPEGGTVEVVAENVLVEAGSLPVSPGKYVRISVRDHGCGIAPEILARIFDPYFTTKPTGSGLGLATAHAIVAKHGGHIAVESEAGAGTVFRIHLPACERAPAPAGRTGEALQRGSGRVLVMDDDPALRKLLQRILERLGYDVVCASHGVEAIALYEQARSSGRGFDLVLLDLTIPGGMGGMETVARLKTMDPAAKVIATSGYSDAPVMSDFRAYGFDDALPKPWTPTQVSAVFTRVLPRALPPDSGQ